MLKYQLTLALRCAALMMVLCLTALCSQAVSKILDATIPYPQYGITSQAGQGKANATATLQALQDRLDYAVLSGIGVVTLPAGDWYINKPLSIPPNTALCGEADAKGNILTRLFAAPGCEGMPLTMIGHQVSIKGQAVAADMRPSLNSYLDNSAQGHYGIRTFSPSLNQYFNLIFADDPLSYGAYRNDATNPANHRAVEWGGMDAFTLDLGYVNYMDGTRLTGNSVPIWIGSGHANNMVEFTLAKNGADGFGTSVTIKLSNGAKGLRLYDGPHKDALGLFRVIIQFDFPNNIIQGWVKGPHDAGYQYHSMAIPAGSHLQESLWGRFGMGSQNFNPDLMMAGLHMSNARRYDLGAGNQPCKAGSTDLPDDAFQFFTNDDHTMALPAVD